MVSQGPGPDESSAVMEDIARFHPGDYDLPMQELQVETRKLVSLNPATGEVLREIECAGETEIEAAVVRARKAQQAWAELGLRRRISIVRKFQARLYQRKSEIAEAITREAGKPVAEALVTEVLVVLDAARFLIDNAWGLLRDEPVPHGNLVTKLKSGWLVREPHGVIGIISPWNYPFSIPATETLAALVSGNAVVLKPSELTPLVAMELASLLHEAGVPENVFHVVTGEGPAGAALLRSPIDKLVFTGSVTTGKKIAVAAADRLLPVVLELGGKDPMLIRCRCGCGLERRGVGSVCERRAGMPVRGAVLRASEHV